MFFFSFFSFRFGACVGFFSRSFWCTSVPVEVARTHTHTLSLSPHALWSSRFRYPDIQRFVVPGFGVPHLQAAKAAPSFFWFVFWFSCLCNMQRFESSFTKSIC
jgi:hypothetical protein